MRRERMPQRVAARPLANPRRHHRRAGLLDGCRRPPGHCERADTGLGTALCRGLTAGGAVGSGHISNIGNASERGTLRCHRPTLMGSDGMGVAGVRVGWVWAAKLDLRNPQIGTCFRPLGREAGDSGETEQGAGSLLWTATKHRFRGFPGGCEIELPQTSEPRVGSSSLSERNRIAQAPRSPPARTAPRSNAALTNRPMAAPQRRK